eukprot:TRINITY_DN33555_c0_g1_i1.p1 TRINITY_DN33555_c0_g1~~TRINITY_DN33555_c0_g1_i1.p1  ORF type:complete len:311 (+),score=90.37 TRINITY_DN33555_c0_g1_i1:70-1002(+)
MDPQADEMSEQSLIMALRGLEDELQELPSGGIEDDLELGKVPWGYGDTMQRLLAEAMSEKEAVVPEVGDYVVVRGGNRHHFRDYGDIHPSEVGRGLGLVHAGGRVVRVAGAKTKRVTIVGKDLFGHPTQAEVPCVPHSIIRGDEEAHSRRQAAAMKQLLHRRNTAAARCQKHFQSCPAEAAAGVAVHRLADESLAPTLVHRAVVHQCRATGRVLLAEAVVESDGKALRSSAVRYYPWYDAATAFGGEEEAGAEDRAPSPVEVQALRSLGVLTDDEAATLLALVEHPPGTWQQVYDDISRDQNHWPWQRRH